MIIWFVLIFFIIQFGNAFDPKKLIISTILDISNEIVTRDTFTLIRSLKLFGGRINEGKLVIVIPPYDQRNSVKLPQILKELTLFNATVHFSSAIDASYSGTMKKFLSFSIIEKYSFETFLWIDADIVILNDPTPYFEQMTFSTQGEIKCVPELYNYLKRYPEINMSEVLRNPHLEDFLTMRDHQSTSHGICNTGMLLFNRDALLKVNNVIRPYLRNPINSPIDDFFPLDSKKDRFFDSLLFIYALNQQTIKVGPLPISFNYMAYFEDEVMLFLESNIIYFAHFVDGSEFFCKSELMEDSRLCRCTFNPVNWFENSKLIGQLNPAGNYNSCLFLSGYYQEYPLMLIEPKNSKHILAGAIISKDNNEIIKQQECNLLWPQIENWSLEVHNSRETEKDIILESILQCNFINQSVYFYNEYHLSRSVMIGKITQSVTLIWYPKQLSFQSYNNNNSKFNTHYVFYPSNSFNTTILLYNEYYRHQRVNTVYRKPPSPIAIRQYPLITSQLKFSEYLVNSRLFSGIIFCCQSKKGIQSVQNIIQHLSFSNYSMKLLIIVMSQPLPNSANTLEIFAQEHFGQICSNVSNRPDNYCSLVISEFFPRWITNIASQSYDFVFVDAYKSYSENLFLLTELQKILTPGGIAMGSRYIDHSLHNCLKKNFEKLAQISSSIELLLSLHEIKLSLEQIFFRPESIFMNYMLTYQETFLKPCIEKIKLLSEEEIQCDYDFIMECSPSWYFVNL